MHIVCIHIHTYLYLITTYLYIFTIYISYIHIYIIYMHMHAHPPNRTYPFSSISLNVLLQCQPFCHLPFATHIKNKKTTNMSIQGNPKKQKTLTHTQTKKNNNAFEDLPPPPNSKGCLLKLPIVFISQNGYPSFFWVSSPQPKTDHPNC